MTRQNVSSGARWESVVGYSRAVRVGGQVHIAGTVAVGEDGKPLGGDAYTQAKRIFQIIERALQEVGASMRDVVRTRTFLTNIQDWEQVGRAHGEYFRDIRPAATMLAVAALISPDVLVEIEVDAIVDH
jgi:enamine deaminase RidA (YjgF/YER057c/UK114 family)